MSLRQGFVANGPAVINVMRPQLPSAMRLAPYLKRIDETRIYSNHGPLVLEFEQRLEARFAVPGLVAKSAASGTAALVGAILAAAGRAKAARRFALVPAYTFVATAAAAELCGYEVYLADVDRETWMLDPASVAAHPMLDQVGVVIPVAPYGRPVPIAPWQEFRARTGIPVVFDDAAASDRLAAEPGSYLGDIPACLSFHATKSLACGEGGAVLTTDGNLAEAALRALNFGFRADRDSTCAGINGKMSEYHAAIGLAELDSWDEKLARLQCIVDAYRLHRDAAGCLGGLVTAPDVSLSYVLYRCADTHHAERTAASLRKALIEYRFWYNQGLHSNAYFAHCSRDRLCTTARLAATIIGLPMSMDLGGREFDRIGKAVKEAQESA